MAGHSIEQLAGVPVTMEAEVGKAVQGEAVRRELHQPVEASIQVAQPCAGLQP